GALRGRLERARECLRLRLVRRGVGLPAALLGTTLASAQASAVLPPTLAIGTVKAATALATGQALARVVPAHVATLTEGVLQAMFVTKLKMVVALVLTASVLGAGVLAGAAWSEREIPVAPEAGVAAPVLAAEGKAADRDPGGDAGKALAGR